ncbi:MAG: hypothetical protein JRG83_14280 [Deltaproteobacteria bacterium]|nr:hypothetical protein [Deltaproteobacteria bacterium]
MRNPIFAGLALVLNALCSWYFAFYCLIFTAMFLLARFLEDGRALLTSAFAKRIGVIALVSFVVIAPLLLPMIHAKLSNTYLVEHDSIIWSADLQSFFIPNGVLTWGRLWFLDWIETWTGNSAENANYIGYGLLALSIYGWARIPKSRFWGAAGLGFAILALGPYLHVGGQVHEGFPLPYRFLERYTPLVGFMGVPERMTLMLYTCLAVVAALSLTRIAESAGGGRRGTAVVLTIGALLMVEYRATPFPTVRLDIPHFYRELAQEPERFGVIDVPRDSRALYFSTIHGKPLVGGYVSRRAQSDRDFLEQTPIIATLTVGAPAPSEARRLARAVFTEHDIRYVILRSGSHVGFLEETLALPLHFEGDGIRVYRTLRGPVGVDTPREAGGEISDRARIR